MSLIKLNTRSASSLDATVALQVTYLQLTAQV